MYQYHCLNPIADVGLNLFNDKYKKTEELTEAEALLVRSASVHDVEFPEGLRAIARAGAGVNNIPLEKCAEAGIVVFNTPGANANGVKELVLAGLFLAARDIAGGVEWVKSMGADPEIARMAEKHKNRFAGGEIKGKKLGVIGLGAIGVKVANAAAHLGMEVHGYDPYISVKAAWNLSRNVRHTSAVEDIYRECDYITLHIPLLDSTKKMVNKEAFAQMKDGVVLLNFSRDSLVDDEALLAAISGKKVRRYVTDFPNPAVAGQEGCLVIPHLGASTEESENNCAVMAVEQLKDYLEHGTIKNSVNYPNCDLGICQGAVRIALLHRNHPGMISKYSTVMGNAGINVTNLTNKSRGEYAYALLDLETDVTEEALAQLRGIEGVLKVRVIKP
ncbi:3-phosphoglycerate dehydrogenase [Clostridia bacterium]|nr:3-phosphoglycerate dehydrogenase [Clostridia bacterium]